MMPRKVSNMVDIDDDGEDEFKYVRLEEIFNALDQMIVDLEDDKDEFSWSDNERIWMRYAQRALDEAQTNLKKLLRGARKI